MPAFFIPPLGTRLRLLRDWEFPLHREYRNSDAWELLVGDQEKMWNGVSGWGQQPPPFIVSLPQATILNVERIFIRSGAKDFDSVTFRVMDSPNKAIAPKKVGGRGGKCRFWVKLDDVNGRMEYEVA
jgi:hypothetical protein